MKKKTLHLIVGASKVSSIVLGLAAVTHFLPLDWAVYANLIFQGASAAKDGMLAAGDVIDDGKRNNSFNPETYDDSTK